MNLHKYSQFTDSTDYTILHTCFYSFHLYFKIKVPRHSVYLYLYLFAYFAISLVNSSYTLLQHATCILPYSFRPLFTLLIRVQKSIQQVRMPQKHKREIKEKRAVESFVFLSVHLVRTSFLDKSLTFLSSYLVVHFSRPHLRHFPLFLHLINYTLLAKQTGRYINYSSISLCFSVLSFYLTKSRLTIFLFFSNFFV